jgi:hypothetical protein
MENKKVKWVLFGVLVPSGSGEDIRVRRVNEWKNVTR